MEAAVRWRRMPPNKESQGESMKSLSDTDSQLSKSQSWSAGGAPSYRKKVLQFSKYFLYFALKELGLFCPLISGCEKTNCDNWLKVISYGVSWRKMMSKRLLCVGVLLLLAIGSGFGVQRRVLFEGFTNTG